MTQKSSTANLRAWVEVDHGALVRNARALAAHAGVPLLPMVKADAYGLGAIDVARSLHPLAPWGFGVATVDEGIALREAGIAERIVLFSPPSGRDLSECLRRAITPTLSDPDAIADWGALGAAPWHLAVDTGMHRAGVPWDAVAPLAAALAAAPPEGVFTHYHSPERDDGSLAVQDERFAAALAGLPVRPALTHTDNSAAIVRRASQTHALVRPGVFLYGVGSGPRVLAPEPVAHVRARVIELRDVEAGETVSYGATWRANGRRRIATVALGYADGYRRHLSNVGCAILRTAEVPVVGVVTMDMTMLDVTGVECAVGDVATFLGRDGTRVLTAEAVARDGGLSPYELLTGLKLRLPRIPVTSAP